MLHDHVFIAFYYIPYLLSMFEELIRAGIYCIVSLHAMEDSLMEFISTEVWRFIKVIPQHDLQRENCCGKGIDYETIMIMIIEHVNFFHYI